jgi:hypothetical protein
VRQGVLFGLVGLIVLLDVAAAVSASRTPATLKGCRQLGAAYDTNERAVQDQLSSDGVVNLRKGKDASLRAIFKRGGADAMLSADLGAWCKAKYPHDPTVQRASWPTRPVR